MHRWDVSPSEAIRIQKRLVRRLIRKDRFGGIGRIRTVAGADCAFDDGARLAIAGVVVFSFPDLQEIERASAIVPLRFPYVPGLLAFREGPALLAAFRRLKTSPDLILFDGQGIAHPRGLGIASHMGLLLGRPAIGCAKSHLFGDYEEPGPRRGDWSPIRARGRRHNRHSKKTGKAIGAVLRTRDRVRPIFVSTGHRVGLESAIQIVLKCVDGLRIPKPTREADRFVSDPAR